jgi:hypothetical protein
LHRSVLLQVHRRHARQGRCGHGNESPGLSLRYDTRAVGSSSGASQQLIGCAGAEAPSFLRGFSAWLKPCPDTSPHSVGFSVKSCPVSKQEFPMFNGSTPCPVTVRLSNRRTLRGDPDPVREESTKAHDSSKNETALIDVAPGSRYSLGQIPALVPKTNPRTRTAAQEFGPVLFCALRPHTNGVVRQRERVSSAPSGEAYLPAVKLAAVAPSDDISYSKLRPSTAGPVYTHRTTHSSTRPGGQISH